MRIRVGFALTLALLMGATSLASPALAATDLLPDMKMAPIYDVQLATTAHGRKKLRFGTISFNIGDGPIEVRGSRRDGNEMRRVRQWIYRSDGTVYSVLKPDARMFFAGDDHDHWHLAKFIVTRLRPNPGTSATERRIRKLGFCLLDSTPMQGSQRPPNAVDRPVYGGCGSHDSRRVTAGISVGWGDDYPPHFTFQAIDVTGLPAGSYRLCATVNPKGIWTETNNNHSNNSYWMDLDLDVAQNSVSVSQTGQTPCS